MPTVCIKGGVSQDFIQWLQGDKYGKIFPEKIVFYKDKLRVATGEKGKLDFTFNKSSIQYANPLIWA